MKAPVCNGEPRPPLEQPLPKYDFLLLFVLLNNEKNGFAARRPYVRSLLFPSAAGAAAVFLLFFTCLHPHVSRGSQNVDLTACFYIRDASIEVLLQRCPHVELLSLRNCRKLTDLTLDHVAEGGKNISALDIGGCFNMTAPGVDALCSTHPNRSR